MNARYEIVEDVEGKPLVIRDIGPWDRHRSVTNDADHVVKELYDAGKLDAELQAGRRLFYYDSDGQLDELVYDVAGKFRYFAPSRHMGTKLEQALAFYTDQ